MNNRLGLGLAVGAGYFLGRTKKLKFAFAVGTFVAGKKLQLSPKALMDFASSQLQNNPQFKELGDQLREDMQGVGKAATGAIINRQLSGLADKLHDRTLSVQDKAAGVVPDISSLKDKGGKNKKQADDDSDEEYDEQDEDQQDEDQQDQQGQQEEEREEPRRQARPRKQSSSASSSSGTRAAKKTTGSARTSGRGAAKKTASSGTAKKTAGSAAKKTTGTAKKTAARRTGGAKGGQNRA
ncbi:DNA primase [Streptomyces sp. NPDC091272]|uniref:DNA primase n=1 Tax=Streptomyces sp. NPDC091272 TaxID=3365981 RepID=UPI0038179B5C